jgi:hypothetical protein
MFAERENYYKEKRFSRRKFIAAAGATAFLIFGGDKLGVFSKFGNKFKEILDVLDDPYGKFLMVEDGKLKFTDTPEVVKVQFIPQYGPTTAWNRGRIVVRRQPNIWDDNELIPYYDIRASYATRVFGGTYVSQSPDGMHWGQLNLTYKDQEHRGGLWFVLTNEKGQPVNPDGVLLKEGEKPFYVAGSFVTVLESTKK